MRNLANLFATVLILSATFWAAGWIQGADKVTLKNVEFQKQVVGAKWEIIAPRYSNPDFGDEFKLGYLEVATVIVVTHENSEDLNDRLKVLFPDSDSLVAAFAFQGDGTCYIHITEIKDWNDKGSMQSLGHEILHCFGAHHIGDTDEETRNENSQRGYQIS